MAEILNIVECDVAELKNCLQNGARNLIDVREYAEFAGGRVKGAKLIPLGDIEKRYAEIERDKPAFVICRSGKRASEAQRKLLALGFSDVRNVRGGFEAWKAAGFDFEKDAKAVWSLERQVRFAAGSLVVLGVVLSLLLHPYFIALSAFVGAGLVFAAATETCGMAMMLAKMPWNKTNGATCETAAQKI
ncbi:MAG TPA: rhodanese-like domain-containing protein [Pyrinomonadaceae bacterium]|nr:rhodanese-like domain-containing protein [Pyrinomonadaceae bacterium]